jgi:hypothetical protein
VIPTRAGLAVVAVILIGLPVPFAHADEIIFGGGSGGTVQIVGDILDPSFHQFTLASAPLNQLFINGTAITFSGSLDIGATGTTTDASGDLLFSAGNLTVSSGANSEVTGQLLGAVLGPGSSGNTGIFLGVLDPANTTFGDLLSSQGSLIGGIGGTDFKIEVPIINPPIVGFQGTAVDSGVILETTPEPSGFVLFGTGLIGLISLTFRRLGIAGGPKL